MEFCKHNWATISETICPQMLIFGKQASWTLSFQNILTNPIISEISFYDVTLQYSMGLTVSQTVNGKSTLGSRGYFFVSIMMVRGERTSWSQGSESDGQEISDPVEVAVLQLLLQYMVRSSQRKSALKPGNQNETPESNPDLVARGFPRFLGPAAVIYFCL